MRERKKIEHIFEAADYPRRNPALPLADVFAWSEPVPRKRTQLEALRAPLDGEWLLRAENYLRPRDHVVYSCFN
jgi:hypothetical protein